VKIQPLIAIL